VPTYGYSSGFALPSGQPSFKLPQGVMTKERWAAARATLAAGCCSPCGGDEATSEEADDGAGAKTLRDLAFELVPSWHRAWLRTQARQHVGPCLALCASMR
jgi:hypothetical protein